MKPRPKGWQETGKDLKERERRRFIRHKLQHVMLQEFTIEERRALMRVEQFSNVSGSELTSLARDYKLLERKIRRLEKKVGGAGVV
ncbi:MAG: hypothetical protein Q7S15_01500 [bacterium]|nr:hypothetical protein [bacterium]